MEWGTTEFEKEESRRSTFYGEQINSFITGEKILFFSDQSRKKLFLYSNAVILGMIVIVLVFIAIIFYLQIFLSMKFDDDGMKTYINYTINLCLALQINFFNMYCDNLAERLTENENHRYFILNFEIILLSFIYIIKFYSLEPIQNMKIHSFKNNLHSILLIVIYHYFI